MTCEQKLDSILTKIDLIQTSIATIKTDVASTKTNIANIKTKVTKLDYLVDSDNKILIDGVDFDVDDIDAAVRVTLGVNPKGSGSGSLINLISILLGVSLNPSSQNNVVRLILDDLSSPSGSTSLSSISVDVGSLCRDSLQFKSLLGVS